MANAAGKGSKLSPSQVPKEQFENNWDKIFGNKKRDEVKNKTSCGNDCNSCSRKQTNDLNKQEVIN